LGASEEVSGAASRLRGLRTAAKTPEQKTTEGAPADFGGMVLPNPRGIRVTSDTDPVIPATQLPTGVSFRPQLFQGKIPMDISNPPRAQIIPPLEREQ
jgi:hypothetical protein